MPVSERMWGFKSPLAHRARQPVVRGDAYQQPESAYTDAEGMRNDG